MGAELGPRNGPMVGPYRQIILFGDSLTEQSGNQRYVDDEGKPYNGFAFLPAVQNWLVRRFDVLNRGFSGYNTAAAKIILPQFMPSPEQATVSLIVIFFGANDSALPLDSPENQHVPLNDYKQNLKAIINDPTVKIHSPRILLVTPPPIDEYKLDAGWLSGSRKAEITNQYAKACCEVGIDENVTVLDLWTEMIKDVGGDVDQPNIPGSKKVPQLPNLSALFTDGLHLSEAGYKLLWSAFSTKIKTIWPELEEANGTENKTVFPLWRDAMASLHAGKTLMPHYSRI